MRRKIIVPAVGAIVVLAIGVVAFDLESTSKTSAASPTPPVPVVGGVVAQHDVPIYLTGVGTVIAYNTAIIHSQIQGQIVSINFTEGQAVHSGDLLAQIDPRPNQAAYEQALATKAKDAAQLENAKRDLERYTVLQPEDLAQAATVEAIAASS